MCRRIESYTWYEGTLNSTSCLLYFHNFYSTCIKEMDFYLLHGDDNTDSIPGKFFDTFQIANQFQKTQIT